MSVVPSSIIHVSLIFSKQQLEPHSTDKFFGGGQ